jgi:3-hydroxy-9,10-secoandrosta-1,3,5(10)-triene-9,17-dione monooxygenase reductase component
VEPSSQEAVCATVPEAADEVVEAGRRMRAVMGHFATGVSVVTVRGPEGRPLGMTANAITSVSLDPPLLLACLASGSRTLAAIRARGRFAINILAADQRHHSDCFAGRRDPTRPTTVDFTDHRLGVPMLSGTLATVVCEVDVIHAAGDHEIVVGEVRDLRHAEERARPLLFWRGDYQQLHPPIHRDEGDPR